LCLFVVFYCCVERSCNCSEKMSLADLANSIKTHRVWWVLWVLLGVFWIVGFSYYCAQLDQDWFEGKKMMGKLINPFLTGGRMREAGSPKPPPPNGTRPPASDWRSQPQPRYYPSWFICPGIPSNFSLPSNATDVQCTQCIPSRRNPCNQTVEVLSYYNSTFNCFIFNSASTCAIISEKKPGTHVNCSFSLDNTDVARLYLIDQNWTFTSDDNDNSDDDDDDDTTILVDGIVQRTLPLGTRNLVEISRSQYVFSRKHKEYGYQLMDGESYNDQEGVVSLLIYYGDLYEWQYTQAKRDNPYGYGFWLWICSIGGLTMLVYAFHTCIYGGVCFALGWENYEYRQTPQY